MNKDIYIEAIKNSNCAFAYHKAVFDKNGKMVDYIFLDVNEAFEKFTGLKKENIINKRFVGDISKIISQTKDYAMTWVKQNEKVFTEKKAIEFEYFFKGINKHFEVKAYSTDEECFVTLFADKTIEKKIQEMAKYFGENLGESIDYHRITELAQEITGAEIAAFNLFDGDGKDFTTLALIAKPDAIKQGESIFNRKIVGKKWLHDPLREELISNNEITYFESLNQLTEGVISKKVIQVCETLFDLGETVIAKIEKDGITIGDFTLVFKKNRKIQNENFLKMYLSYVGLFIENNKAQQSIKESQKRFYALSENAPLGFVFCNREGKIQYANKKLLEIMDSKSYETIVGFNLFEMEASIESGFSAKLKKSMDNNKEITCEMSYKSVWGKETWLRVTFTPMTENDRVIGANISLDDLTEDMKTQNELRLKAEKDPLTGAYNRHALENIIPNRLEEAKEKGLISCVVLLDIDNFKAVNDKYGHGAGDKVLQYLASRIKQELRKEDIIIRVGGDEFLIYLHNIKNEECAVKFVERIFKKITVSYRLDSNIENKVDYIDISCSVGSALYPKSGKDISELMLSADKSLYIVKKSGKSNYHIGIQDFE